MMEGCLTPLAQHALQLNVFYIHCLFIKRRLAVKNMKTLYWQIHLFYKCVICIYLVITKAVVYNLHICDVILEKCPYFA